ncbi:MAG TPA: carboxypeptidase-like regulatory domain-containing protein, partial [Planctomycetaceae bacterium]|nr:carboxypeptidase-like regulatory domain-containing protein [Planctomycetaceae bacterium]
MNHVVRLAVLASFGLTAVYAQFDSGQISGFVRDPSQSVVAGASVTVTNEGNGAKQRVVTNSSGYYVAPNLFVGTYSVEVEAPGFKKSVQ